MGQHPGQQGRKHYSDSASDDDFRKTVEENFALMSERMDQFESALRKNTSTTDDTLTNTTELVEIFKAVKGGFKVLEWLGRAAKWVGGIAIVVGTVWKLMGLPSPFK